MNPMVLLIVGLLLLIQQPDLSLEVDHSVAPAHPLNTLATGVSVVEIELNGRTGGQQTRLLYGTSPFAAPGLNALMSWGFALPPQTNIARTSITFLFRSPAGYPVSIPPIAIKPGSRGPDSSAIPQEIVDPGYPMTSTAQGAVIFAVRISAEGAVTGVKTISGDSSLAGQSQQAVKNWRFSPARTSGKEVSSTAYVVISFVRPT
jgi:hypothetical protein